MKLDDLNIYDIGNTIGLVGAVFAEEGGTPMLCMFPDHGDLPDHPTVNVLRMDVDEWQKFLRQTDLLETEVLSKTEHGKLAKAILRKTARMIDSRVSWNVFKRDQFRCRYCGRDDLPLSVDHLVLWEEGGPSTMENMVAACKKCNKTRGNTPYPEWLKHPYYIKVSRNLTSMMKDDNEALVATLDAIPRNVHVRSRG